MRACNLIFICASQARACDFCLSAKAQARSTADMRLTCAGTTSGHNTPACLFLLQGRHHTAAAHAHTHANTHGSRGTHRRVHHKSLPPLCAYSALTCCLDSLPCAAESSSSTDTFSTAVVRFSTLWARGSITALQEAMQRSEGKSACMRAADGRPCRVSSHGSPAIGCAASRRLCLRVCVCVCVRVHPADGRPYNRLRSI